VNRPLRIVCVGGGPGGLFFALLMKRANPHHDVVVLERNRADDTFGFGVVFSDATMAGIADADSEAYARLPRTSCTGTTSRSITAGTSCARPGTASAG
jgi:2-polyprenyl-6-methoxyphenol hydroxylase-like FAD-dependent oxidoreductase